MSSFESLNCPPGCAYAMKLSNSGDGRITFHCGYILITGKMRGCDPGQGCSRYEKQRQDHPKKQGRPLVVKNEGSRKKAKPPTPPGPKWDVARGRELWLRGYSHRKIAEELGCSILSVHERVSRCWKHGRD